MVSDKNFNLKIEKSNLKQLRTHVGSKQKVQIKFCKWEFYFILPLPFKLCLNCKGWIGSLQIRHISRLSFSTMHVPLVSLCTGIVVSQLRTSSLRCVHLKMLKYESK